MCFLSESAVVRCMGGMLKGGMSTCNALVIDRKCDHENLCEHLEYYKTNREKRERKTG